MNRVWPRFAWVLGMLLVAPLATAQTEVSPVKTPPPPKRAQVVSTQPSLLADYLRRFDNPHIQPYAYVLSTAVWPSSKIYVCWDNPAAATQTDMDIVREAVQEAWEKNSALTFSGWGPCAKVNRGIRITVADAGPHTKGLGKQLDGVISGMVLNFTFNNWSTTCRDSANRVMCIRSIAIHEFGHALGFAHEQNRHDAPGECQKIAQGPDGDKMLTPYDKSSVMNYCFNIYNPELMLSELDLSALITLYGAPVNKLSRAPSK